MPKAQSLKPKTNLNINNLKIEEKKVFGFTL